MSLLSTNQEIISKSALNQSPTKMMFSFPKAERFRQDKGPR